MAVCGEAVGKYAAGAARADDDEIELACFFCLSVAAHCGPSSKEDKRCVNSLYFLRRTAPQKRSTATRVRIIAQHPGVAVAI